jgi:hypothetical protein
LNTRFKELFEQLQKEGKINRHSRKDASGMSIKHLAERLFDDDRCGHIVGLYLSGKRKIKYEEAKKFCEIFDLDPNILLRNPPLRLETTAIVNQPFGAAATRPNILYAPIEAFASNAEDIQDKGECDYFQIPGLHGDFIAFSVKGNSMYPTLTEGDIVICSKLDDARSLQYEIKENDIYVVSVNNAAMVKRVQLIYDKTRKKVSKLKLISDNYLEHDPIEVDALGVHQIWKVQKKITSMF